MSHGSDTSVAASSEEDVCPTCNQRIISSSDACSSNSASDSAKHMSSTSSRSTLTSVKKTRNSKTTPSSQYTRPWDSRPDFPVWVNAYDGYGWRGWIPAVVDKVIDYHDGFYNIVVVVEDENGDRIVPMTINSHNYDPIPNKVPSDPNYKLSHYIIQRDESIEGLSGAVLKQWRCLKYYSGPVPDSIVLPDLDPIGEALLGNENSTTSLSNLVRSLMLNEKVKEVVKLATNEDVCSPQHALAYFIGQFCGIEVSETGTQDVDPKNLLDKIGCDNSVVDCSISQVFLLSAMCARTHKTRGMNPAAQLFDSRAREVFSDPQKLKVRMNRLKTSLAAIHASQTNKPSVAGPAFALLSHGISMMIDMRGTSDPLLDRLAEEGVCRPARVLRMWIHKLAAAIDPLNARPPASDGRVNVVAWTADNADHHLFHRVVSCVPVANLLLCDESTEDSEHLNKNYMSGLGMLSDLEAEDITANVVDDEIAQEIIDRQNILALLNAAIDSEWMNGWSGRRRTGQVARPTVDSTVSFSYRSEEWEGVVKSVSSGSATIEFSDAGRQTTKCIPLEDINFQRAGTGGQRIQQEQQRDHPVPNPDFNPEMFGGDRHHFEPTTTSIVSILTGLSSKNNETARQVIQEIIAQHGEEQFLKAVHVVVADQEFMPTMINQFFSRLRTEDELPILPVLAIGHAMKGVSVSMMAYYKCFFDPMIEALGIKLGSPEHSRLYKGTVIRKTTSLVTDFTEMLALAAARQYLTEVGSQNRVTIGDQGPSPPKSLIQAYLSSKGRGGQSVTVLESTMRPLSIKVTDALTSVAKDFQMWARGKWGTSKRVEVGPSGYERSSALNLPQEEDMDQLQLSMNIEDDTENFSPYLNMNYIDDGDRPGLLTRCTNAGCLHRVQVGKRSSDKSAMGDNALRLKMEAEQSLREDGHVVVPPSSALLDGIKKAGEGKASVYPAVLSTMSSNEPSPQKDGQIGDGPSKPVILSRSKLHATKYIMERAKRPGGGRAPIHRFVDIAKDLRGFIPRREGGKNSNTVIELARDLISHMITKYYSYGVDMICLTMDCASNMTTLRAIPHYKRGKMDGISMTHGSLSKVKKGTDDLTPHGARSDLLVCGDQSFMGLLFNTMCNQAKAIATGAWSPPQNNLRFVLVVIGGSPQACVAAAVGTDRVRLNSKSITVTCEDIENEMEASRIVCQEEGEMMVYGAMRSMFRLGFTHDHSAEGLDSVSEIFSDDSDAFAGISMQAIYNLESTCMLRGKFFQGSIFLHGAAKSASQVSRLGNIFKTNVEVDHELCPTGRGFESMVDLVAVYYILEQEKSLPALPPGHRAITLVAVTYTLLNHDYLRVAGGLTYRSLIATLKSTSYKAEMSKCSAQVVSPINLTRQAVFMDQNHGANKGYNLRGILLLLHHAFINRSATKKILLKKYSPSALSDNLNYHVVRAAAILAEEKYAVPDPIALLSHLSCANIIFRRWSCILYDRNRKTDDELKATSYVESNVKGRTLMSIDYTLCSLVQSYRRSWSDANLLRALRTSKYGALFSDCQLQTNSPLPFDPMKEVRTALEEYQGFYPSLKISGELLPDLEAMPVTGATEDEDELANFLQEIREESLEHPEDEDDMDSSVSTESDDERSVAGSVSGDERWDSDQSDNDED